MFVNMHMVCLYLPYVFKLDYTIADIHFLCCQQQSQKLIMYILDRLQSYRKSVTQL